MQHGVRLQSASILLYLTRVYDTNHVFHFKDEDMQQEMMNWIFFMFVLHPFCSVVPQLHGIAYDLLTDTA